MREGLLTTTGLIRSKRAAASPEDEESQRPDDAEDKLLAAWQLGCGGHRSRLQGASQISIRRSSVTNRKPNEATTATSTKISAARSLVE